MAEICNAAQGNGGSAPWRRSGGKGGGRAGRGGKGGGGEGRGGGRMQKSECTPRDTRRWNGSTRYLITYFAKLRQRRRRRSNRPSHPSAHLFNHHPPSLFHRCLSLWIFQRAALESWQRASSGLFILATLACKLVEISTSFSWNGFQDNSFRTGWLKLQLCFFALWNFYRATMKLLFWNVYALEFFLFLCTSLKICIVPFVRKC